MLVRRPRYQGSVGKAILEKRFDDYAAGCWAKLLADARASAPANKPRATDAASTLEVEGGGRGRCLALAGDAKQRGPQRPNGAALGPGTADTVKAMQSKSFTEARIPLSQDALGYHTPAPLLLNKTHFLESLRTATRGSALGPGVCT